VTHALSTAFAQKVSARDVKNLHSLGLPLGTASAYEGSVLIITAIRRYNIGMTEIGDALSALSETLDARHLEYELVAVGGSSLVLLGLITRATRDLDIVAVVEAGRYVGAGSLPQPLVDAVRDVGEVLGIGIDWLNSGPSALLDFGLPQGFAERAEVRSFGALTLRLASRFDQIYLKLYAAVDQGPRSKHVDDLRALEPSHDELRGAAVWARTHDPSPAFREELLAALRLFGVDDADV
jgi:hypothetical protein